MSRILARERFGAPQLLVGALLLVFLAQASWLIHQQIEGDHFVSAAEQTRLAAGWRQLHGKVIAGDPYPDPSGSLPEEMQVDAAGFDTQRSPLLSLATAAPLLLLPRNVLDAGFSPEARWLARAPFLVCGVLLGASLWYVARRLCGNLGGFVALTLYCFSPGLIQSSAAWHVEPNIVVAWGSFGVIFTAIAVAHTLYAPRDVVLWNWRRILLLGIAMAIAVGTQFSMILVIPLALLLMLYVAPVRREAGLVIWCAGCLVAFWLLFALYFFHGRELYMGLQHASFGGIIWSRFTSLRAYEFGMMQLLRGCPGLIFLLPTALATYMLRRKSRYFGNTAPAIIALIFIAIGVGRPEPEAIGFLLSSLSFVLLFVSGVVADLMETSYRPFVISCVTGLLCAYIAWDIFTLAQVPPG